MTDRVSIHHLQVATSLYQFIETQVLPTTGLAHEAFWRDFDALVADLAPQNMVLLAQRDRLQFAMDDWHRSNPGPIKNAKAMKEYRKFLSQIGYLVNEPLTDPITTKNVDAELASLSGPQLVVPILNARYALNAVNARWGSLYDALYGTDAISENDGCEKGAQYNLKRGARVNEYCRYVLDRCAPLKKGSHIDSTHYAIKAGKLAVTLKNGSTTGLLDDKQCVGFQGEASVPSSVLFVHNGLHLDLQINPFHGIGKTDPAGVCDLVAESALTTILDLEDSVAVVDAEDKVLAYSNWLGILQGTLTEVVQKGASTFTRSLNADRVYSKLSGKGSVTLHGRSLLFVRNVGLLMTNPAILYSDSGGRHHEIPEGILDAVITTAIAMVDLQKKKDSPIRNSRTGSVYIVKPKMHGPQEVAFADTLFGRVEKMLGLAPSTVKLGIMDEERRTSVNLKACIMVAKSRVAFINTGFLDRTGDEMHTCMQGGAVLRKDDMKSSAWLQAYEKNNVLVGLQCGLRGRAQIGKGMWAMPDLMADMLKEKLGHPMAGANTAWVPSPTAATLHAMHYHQMNVGELQKKMEKDFSKQDTKALREEILNHLLAFPVAEQTHWSAQDIQNELDNNAQGILAYVVRWIDQGVGCSKVPNIHGVGLMEDRATLRISSQHIANWMAHGICSTDQVRQTMQRMAAVVDTQNAGDALYKNMAGRFDQSAAYQAACDLVFKGKEQPSGYTEPLLHGWRLKVKASH
ncbi:MAG: malate synthase G [Limnohabitans sp.]|nr:malate synthase G [Limnohabitans sp.]